MQSLYMILYLNDYHAQGFCILKLQQLVCRFITEQAVLENILSISSSPTGVFRV